MQIKNENTEKKNKKEKIRDEINNTRKEILEKIADDAIARNPLIYERLAEI